MTYRIILFLAFFSFLSCSNSSQENGAGQEGATPRGVANNPNLESPDITIHIEGTPQGKAYLVGFYCETQFYVDSTQINGNGRLTFKRQQPYQPGLYLTLFPNQTSLQMMIDEDQTFTLTASANDLVNSMKVEGSLDNELLYQNLRFEANIQPRFQQVAQAIQQAGPQSPEYSQLKQQQDALVEERKQHLENLFRQHPSSLFAKFKKAGQNPDIQDVRRPDGTVDAPRQVFLYKQDFWKDVDFSDERLLYTPVIFNKLRRYMKELTSQNPDSIISAADHLIRQVPPQSDYYRFFTNWIAATNEPGKLPIMDAEAIYVHMVKNYFTEDKAFWLQPAQVQGLQMRADEMANSLIGQKGPNIKVPDTEGNVKALFDIQSPYIIVFMYNPDCDHCQEETPILRNFYNNDWKNKGIEIYAVAIDTEKDIWKKFIKDYQIEEWTNVFDPTNRSIYKTYFVDNTPELYVLNQDRVIIGKNLKPHQVPDVIKMDQQKQ